LVGQSVHSTGQTVDVSAAHLTVLKVATGEFMVVRLLSKVDFVVVTIAVAIVAVAIAITVAVVVVAIVVAIVVVIAIIAAVVVTVTTTN
jgi:hypothetical protein